MACCFRPLAGIGGLWGCVFMVTAAVPGELGELSQPVEEYVNIREHRDSVGKSWQRIMIGRVPEGDGYAALGTRPGDSGNLWSELWVFTDTDLGRPPGRARIALSNVDDGRGGREWAAVLGGGHGVPRGDAGLFVVFIDRGIDGWASGDFVRIPTGVPSPGEQDDHPPLPNGVGEPALVDIDRDGSADLAYAGDLLGNLFRFDISGSDPSSWRAVWLFRAAYGDGSERGQPIAQRPFVVMHPGAGEFLVVFGTGEGRTEKEGAGTAIQSIYGIWDPGEPNPATARPDAKSNRLARRMLTNVVDETAGSFRTRRVLAGEPLRFARDGPGRIGVYGWYIDLDMPRARHTLQGNPNPDPCGQAPPAPQFPGEQVTGRPVPRGTALFMATAIPRDGTHCADTPPGSILAIDMISGAAFEAPVIDLNDDGRTDSRDLVPADGGTPVAGLILDGDRFSGTLGAPELVSDRSGSAVLVVGNGNERVSLGIGRAGAPRTGRLSWRELPDAR